MSDATPTKLDLQSLIARLEAATEGSRELDYEIAKWKLPRLSECVQLPDGRWETPDGLVYAIDYTTSLDAALTLVPEGWCCDMGTGGAGYAEGSWARVYPQSGQAHGTGNVSGQTLPLAICIAPLLARSAS
jgi:hypothetical protein